MKLDRSAWKIFGDNMPGKVGDRDSERILVYGYLKFGCFEANRA